MNNEEFAEELNNYLDSKKFYIDYQNGIFSDFILDYLKENDLQVINTKNQLLGYSVEDVISYYYQDLEHYQEEYPNAPEEMTIEQAQYLLQLASSINSGNQEGMYWDDIDEAITSWLDNYDS